MRSCAVTIVGHVDHGKTALVRALTGQDTDRLAEEKARGLSITLGFAYRAYRSGVIDFIDSPGHEDFIRAMVCGSTGAQAALVVISAVDGVERQTREHLEILGHLDVTCGVVALTKADLVPEAEREAVREQVARALAGSPFASEPHVFCSAASGEGLDALGEALDALIQRAPPPASLPGAFLPVDRVFTVNGVGTVATGTLLGAAMETGDEAVLLPGGMSSTVRRLQSRGADIEAAHPGMRTAVNLRGIGLEHVRRGDVICAPGAFEAATEIDAWVTLQKGAGLKHGEAVRMLVGTGAHVATIAVWGEEKTIAGEGGYVRLRLREPVTSHVGQRGVLRRLSPAETLGGVVVLDPAAPRLRRWDRARIGVLEAVRHGGLPEIAAALAEAGKGAAGLADIRRLSGAGPDTDADLASPPFAVIDDAHLALEPAITEAKEAYLAAVADGLARQPTLASLQVDDVHGSLADRFAAPLLEHVARLLLEAGELTGDRNTVALPGRDPFADLSKGKRERLDRIERALMAGGVSPPGLSELQGERGRDADLVELLVASGRAAALRNVGLKQVLIFHSGALDGAYETLCETFPPPAEFTMAEARAALETSRKYAIPILEHFDKAGLTRRAGDVRQIVPRPD